MRKTNCGFLQLAWDDGSNPETITVDDQISSLPLEHASNSRTGTNRDNSHLELPDFHRAE